MLKISMARFAGKLTDISKRLDTVALPPMKNALKSARKEVKAELLRTGIGRSLWSGKKKSGVPPMKIGTVRPRWSRSKGAYIAGIKLRGMARVIEVGGRVKPHTIKPGPGKKVIAFEGRGGETVFVKRARHPGMTVRKRPSLQPALNRVQPGMVAEVTRELNKLFKEVFR